MHGDSEDTLRCSSAERRRRLLVGNISGHAARWISGPLDRVCSSFPSPPYSLKCYEESVLLFHHAARWISGPLDRVRTSAIMGKVDEIDARGELLMQRKAPNPTAA